MKDGFSLPDSLLLGSATAATQIEGGDMFCNWYQWSLLGKVGKGESSLPGSDHYNRVEEDVKLLSHLNQQCYRMSIEWSRIEPQEGVWSAEGLQHYRNELELLQKANIEVLLTLHHFSCPQWFQEKDAWLNPESVRYFTRFTKYVIENLGDLVSLYCTINEPNVFANDTYMDGNYPPGSKGDIGAYFKASKNLILAHLDCYKLIHTIRKEKNFGGQTKVGFAHHLAVFAPASSHPLAHLGCALLNYLFHTLFFKGFVEGRLPFPLGQGFPKGKGIYCDFMGVNYYSRHVIKHSWNPLKLFGTPMVDPSVKPDSLNDLGWEIYPEGLYKVCASTWKKYKMPIYITENGIPDSSDTKRLYYIATHLWQVKRLVDDGIPVERYYYWSFLDNLEWNAGYEPRFGLVEIDYTTMERKVRPSAHWYSKVCKTKQVTGFVK